ncbi:DUF6634 family protein [Roseicyclus marinus]|uniref:DUF6634 family protein n=1 Tax=Roseicyclus marinus TaxID=2161673 RepID=UPI00240F97D2|nr:DUF6634 family protein [Roseicyclus marinus]MDG3042413.1 hypothetical protein [Roseicyclus marinus]
MTFNKKMSDAAAAVLAGPSADEVAASPILLNWSFTIQWSGSLALAGRVQDSPDFADNEAIVTSPLVFLDQQRGIARTRSRWYRLGAMQPDPERMRGAFRPDPAAVDAFLRAQLVLLIEAQHLFEGTW